MNIFIRYFKIIRLKIWLYFNDKSKKKGRRCICNSYYGFECVFHGEKRMKKIEEVNLELNNLINNNQPEQLNEGQDNE